MTREQRAVTFWAKVDAGDPDDCWEWIRARNDYGYGIVSINNFNWRSHRFAWTLTNGEIPEGLCVLHKCDNPPCCNPEHLFLGTKYDNHQDMIKKGRHVKGEDRINSKLTESQVISIREIYPAISQKALAEIYGVGESLIWKIIKGYKWRHLLLSGNKIDPRVEA